MAGTQQIQNATSALPRGLVARGVVAILFAVVLLVWPGISLRALVLVFGAYAVIDGVVALYDAVTSAAEGRRWWLVLQGVAGVVAGVTAFLWTGLTALALLYVIGSWAIVLGAMDIGDAFSSARTGTDRLLLGLQGFLRIGFGLIMWLRPGAGALALIALIAAFAIVTGVTLIAAAIHLRGAAADLSTRFSPPSAGAHG